MERGRYARICVELDLQKKLVPKFICTSALYNIEYEGLGLICFACGRYGHRKEACPWKPSHIAGSSLEPSPKCMTKPNQEPPESMSPENYEPFGPWMFVKGPAKARSSRPEYSRGNHVEKGYVPKVAKKDDKKGDNRVYQSNFQALEDLEEDIEEMEDMTDVDQRTKYKAKEITSSGSEKDKNIFSKMMVTAHVFKGKGKSKGKTKSQSSNLEKEYARPMSLEANSKAQHMGFVIKGSGSKVQVTKSNCGPRDGRQRLHNVVSENLLSSEPTIIRKSEGQVSEWGPALTTQPVTRDPTCSLPLDPILNQDEAKIRNPSGNSMMKLTIDDLNKILEERGAFKKSVGSKVDQMASKEDKPPDL